MSKTSLIVQNGGIQPKQLTRLLLGLAIVIFVISGLAWWRQVRSNPERVLYGAVENSLRTRSVTRKVAYDGSEQAMELLVSPELRTRSLTTQTSGTNGGSTTVQTEAINTQAAEYVRWTKIETDQKNAKGEQLNFEDLVNVWGRSLADQSGQVGQLQMSLLSGVVPTGNFNAHDRQALMEIVRNEKVYTFDEAKVERKIEDGRPVYVYDVEVSPVAFYKFMKQYGEIVGIQQLKDIDPSQFQGMPAETLSMKIDVWGQHIIAVSDPSGTTEHIGSYGVNHTIEPPKESIPLEELQAKLQSAQE